MVQHLYIDRVDFCSFGNSTPFRIRIVNAYNDNQDYFYMKKADASRVYGLELEHLLSPNRLNYLTHGNTLVEEHIAGVPGDVFINRWLRQPELKPVRIAKELVKFNERCFVRLLGDMRSYNFVFVLTPGFRGRGRCASARWISTSSHTTAEETFTCRSFSGRTLALVQFCDQHAESRPPTSTSARSRRCMLQRAELAAARLDLLLDAMARDPIAPEENVIRLREGLAEHFDADVYLKCETMGALVRENMRQIRMEEAHARVRVPAG